MSKRFVSFSTRIFAPCIQQTRIVVVHRHPSHMHSSIMLLSLILLPLLCSALFEDQLGKFEWHRQGLGVPIHADLHPRKPRLLTLTDTVLAHVHLRDGVIHWRRQLNSVRDVFVSHRDNTVVTVEERNVFKAWSQGDGAMRWERGYDDADAYIFEDGRWPMLTILRRGQLEKRGAADDVLLWMRELKELKECQGAHVFSLQSGDLRLLSRCEDKLLVTSIKGENGEHITTNGTTIAGPDMKPDAFAITDSHIIIIYPGYLCTNKQENGPVECTKTASRHVLLDGILLIIDDKTGQATIKKLEGTVVAKIDAYVIHSPVVGTSESGVFAVISRSSSEWKIAVYNTGDGSFLHEENYSLLPSSFQPRSLFLGTYARKNATTGYRFLLIGRYAEIVLLQQGQIVWERNEATTDIVASMFVDPPTRGAHIHTDIATWIQAQVLGLKVQFRLAKAGDTAELVELKNRLSGKHLAVRDASGYRKYILVLSRYQTIMALHNGDGRILWQTHLQSHQSYAHGEDKRMTVLLYKTGTSAQFAEMDVHTGEILQSGELPPFSKIIKMPHPIKSGSVDRHSFILLNSSKDGDVHGRWLERPDAIVDPYDVILWEAEKHDGIIRGLAVQKTTSEDISFSEIWKLNLHGRIHCMTERGVDDPVHSYTKVLGDRSLLFKYLNPNTALIVVSDEEQEFDDAYLEAFVIDTVTGRILFRQLHESAKGPVHGVISQHWVVYHYWSISNQRFQMSTLEMYDASHRPLTVSDLLLGKIDEERLSSYQPIPVRVYNATFFVPVGVTALSVTKTAKGITTQLVLMATATDQIYAMNRRFLDPRRPIRSTPTTLEERLMPYSEQLPIIATHYASYNRHILSLKGMESSPAGLESGTHVFAYGIDIYYTRLQPERGFDTLDEDFNYAFLVLTLLAMIIGSIFFHFLVQDAKLVKKWK